MDLEFDPEKRDLTWVNRGLDMARAAEIFETEVFRIEDDRRDYGEIRYISAGYLDDRLVVMVWTTRRQAIRIISLRKANDREQKLYGP